jgi:hypothetical protein
MERAWGLHRPAQFKDLGENRFVARFCSKGDWKHVMKNGPWQFDFNVVLLREYDGSIRPSDMVFNSMEIWARVLDLPMDMMNIAYGELFGDWIGKYISVEVDEDGFAWGKELRIRVAVRVDQPLLRGINLKSSDAEIEGKWFDIKYEKIPHFCFDCGCLVHPAEGCRAVKDDVRQWGEWLRASPRKAQKAAPMARPSVSLGSYSTRSSNSEVRGRDGISVRDIPPRRNLSNEFAYSSSSRTGGGERRRETADVTSPSKWQGSREVAQQEEFTEKRRAAGKSKVGTFSWRPRLPPGTTDQNLPLVPLGTGGERGGPNRCGCRCRCRWLAKGALSLQARGNVRARSLTGWK